MSYRAGLLLRIASAVVTIGMFFFLSRVFDAAAPGLTTVGGGYFAFVLLGIVAQEFLSQSIGAFGGALRESQTTGTLELMLLGPSRLGTLLLSSTLWLHASAGLGAVAVSRAWGRCSASTCPTSDVPAALLGLVLMLVGFTGMGLLAGASVLVIKRGQPAGLGAARRIGACSAGRSTRRRCCHAPLQALGAFLPITHGLTVLRGVHARGPGRSWSWPVPLAALAAVSLAFLADRPAGVRGGRAACPDRRQPVAVLSPCRCPSPPALDSPSSERCAWPRAPSRPATQATALAAADRGPRLRLGPGCGRSPTSTRSCRWWRDTLTTRRRRARPGRLATTCPAPSPRDAACERDTWPIPSSTSSDGLSARPASRRCPSRGS